MLMRKVLLLWMRALAPPGFDTAKHFNPKYKCVSPSALPHPTTIRFDIKMHSIRRVWMAQSVGRTAARLPWW